MNTNSYENAPDIGVIIKKIIDEKARSVQKALTVQEIRGLLLKEGLQEKIKDDSEIQNLILELEDKKEIRSIDGNKYLSKEALVWMVLKPKDTTKSFPKYFFAGLRGDTKRENAMKKINENKIKIYDYEFSEDLTTDERRIIEKKDIVMEKGEFHLL